MRLFRSEHAAGWLFVAPATLLIVAFGLVPIGWSFLLSFQSSDFVSPPEWVGVANYQALKDDPEFHAAIVRTLVYTALFVPLVVFGGLAIAVALNAKVRFMGFYRTAVFIPVACSTVATAIIFNWLLEPTYGIVNWALGWVGLGPYGFFQDPDQALVSVVVMTSWGWIGFNAIIYLAALQSIPRELVEAAAIDGAGRFATFRRITWPLLGPATLFLVVWATINALQVFDEIYVSTRGGPLQATTVVVYYLYEQAFRFFAAGYGAAIAYVLFVGILLLTLIQFWVGQQDGALHVVTEQAVEIPQVVTTSSRPPRRLRLPSARHLILLPLALVMVMPLAWMVMTSIQTPDEALQFPPVLPSGIHWQNYPDAFAAAPFGRFFLNSAIVTCTVVLSNLVLCSLAGYAFARFRFLGGNVLFVVLLATLMVPFQVVMIPTFLIMKHLGLVDTLGALIVPNLVTPLGIFLMRQFFRTLPIELEEAARIDGCSRLGTLVRIVLPLSGPALATLAVITFLYTWNDFLWPLVIIQSENNMTLQLGLSSFQGAHDTQWTLLMAGNVMVVVPMLLAFLLAQRHFVNSIASAGVKG